MSFNPEKYRAALAPLNLSKENEDEIMLFVWGVMESAVTSAFGKHPVQQAMQQKQINCSMRESAAMVNLTHIPISEHFCAAGADKP